ncbi:MAG: hypothetical protein AB7T07_06185 [Steroidobacteraceae bacterium]
MSVHSVERVLWDICNSPDHYKAFLADRDELLTHYQLGDAEKQMVRELKVRELMDYNVNPMIIMQTWNAIVGSDKIEEYLGKLNAPARSVEA